MRVRSAAQSRSEPVSGSWQLHPAAVSGLAECPRTTVDHSAGSRGPRQRRRRRIQRFSMSDSLNAMPLLQTPRLRMRTIVRSDVDAIYRLHSDPRAMRYWSFSAWTDPQQAQDWFEQRRHFAEREESWPWGLTLIDADELIGIVTLFAVNRAQRRAEVG